MLKSEQKSSQVYYINTQTKGANMINNLLAKLIQRQYWCTLPKDQILEQLKSITIDTKRLYHKFNEHQDEIHYTSSNSLLDLDCETPETCIILSRTELEDMLSESIFKNSLMC